MRILHTSDWHLGRTFHRVDLLGPQERFLDHLAEVIRAERVDVLLVAGDVYDRALPGVDAVALLDDALLRLRDAGAQIVISSGNHDSPRRLGFGSRLLRQAGLHLRTDPARSAEPVLLEDQYGPVAFYALPYLEPALVADDLGAERSHPAVLRAAMDAVRADLQGRPGIRSVVAAHAFVTGGRGSDSERELAVGGIGQAPIETFDGADYVALGHLHGRQRLSERVRYSGSPLAMSFSEANHSKGSWLVTLGKSGLDQVEQVDAPVPRPLAVLRGELGQLLADPALANAEKAWCQITLTDPARPAAPMERLRQRFAHVLELRFEPTAMSGAAPGYTQKLTGRTDVDVCCGFLEHVRRRPASPAEAALMRAGLEATLIEEMERDGRSHHLGSGSGHDPAELDLTLDLAIGDDRSAASAPIRRGA